MSDDEERLAGGWVNEVVRIGDTVRRSVGPWTPAVHALLRHLEAKGFDAAPRVFGFDEQGREVLTYIEGEPALHPWPEALLQDDGLAAMTEILRRYHEAVSDFVPPADAEWRIGRVRPNQGEIVLHRDPGPWNVVWRNGSPVGLIDWDFAEPGPAINDLAFMAWYTVPLGPLMQGGPEGLDLKSRLGVVCDAYGGVTPAQVLDAVAVVEAQDLERDLDLGGRGIEPWAMFVQRGEVAVLRETQAWLRENRSALL
jgi:hypothetical protein